MIKNIEIWEKFERDLAKKTNTTYIERFKIFDEMLIYRNKMLKDIDILEGLEEKIEFVRRLHRAGGINR